MAINRDKILQEAQKLVEKKRFDKAIAELQKVVADDPTDVRTLLKIGDLHLKLEQFAEAIGTYERVGNYYSQQGFAVKAVAVYKQIREIIQKHAQHLEDRFGHVVPRLAELLTQLDLRSDAHAYYDEVATRLQRVGRDRDAIDVFKKILALDTANPVSHLRLADGFARVRDIEAASQEYAIAADLLVKIGRRDDAIRVVERLLTHRPEGRYARLAAEMYLDRGQPPDTMAALTKLQIAVKENPRDIETLGLLGRAFDQLGQPQKAVEVHKEAARIAKEAGNTEAFTRLLALLQARAPNDEGVRQLALSAHQSVAPPASAARVIESEPPVVEPSVVEFLDDDLEVISEDEPPMALRASYPPDDSAAGMRHFLGLAEAARRDADYAAATNALREGIGRMPGARELREKLCDVLIESGDQDTAVLEMIEFARYLVHAGDQDAAARLLDEVLLLEPQHPDALAMLEQLGYAVPAAEAVFDEESAPVLEPYEFAEEEQRGGYETEPPAVDPRRDPVPHVYEPAPSTVSYESAGVTPDLVGPYSRHQPLPSYDLDEAPDALSLSGLQEVPPVESAQQVHLDDPFASESTSFGMSIPAYIIEEANQERSSPGALDEAALEEIEFFQTHGMFDEAETLLAEQLARLPNHPLLRDRKRELDQARGAAAPPPPSQAAEVDRAYDIAHALDSLDSLDAIDNMEAPAASVHQPANQVSVDAIFEQFKAGVAAQIAEGDAATHYDLGMAYKDMGLVRDALAEFDLASRDPTRKCVCQSMIGMMHLEQGNVDQAIDAFLLGLKAEQKTVEQEVALTYEIGNAYEYRNNQEQALYYFQLVARLNPSHNDSRGSVADRIANLQAAAPPQAPQKAAAVGAPDEFDAALDDLFNPKG